MEKQGAVHPLLFHMCPTYFWTGPNRDRSSECHRLRPQPGRPGTVLDLLHRGGGKECRSDCGQSSEAAGRPTAGRDPFSLLAVAGTRWTPRSGCAAPANTAASPVRWPNPSIAICGPPRSSSWSKCMAWVRKPPDSSCSTPRKGPGGRVGHSYPQVAHAPGDRERAAAHPRQPQTLLGVGIPRPSHHRAGFSGNDLGPGRLAHLGNRQRTGSSQET